MAENISRLFNQFSRCSMIFFTQTSTNRIVDERYAFGEWVDEYCSLLKSLSDRHSNLFKMSKQKNALKLLNYQICWMNNIWRKYKNKKKYCWMSALMTIRRQFYWKLHHHRNQKQHIKICLDVFVFSCNAYTHTLTKIWSEFVRLTTECAQHERTHFGNHWKAAYSLVYNSTMYCVTKWPVIFKYCMALYHLSNILLLRLLVCLHDLNSSPTTFGHGWMIPETFRIRHKNQPIVKWWKIGVWNVWLFVVVVVVVVVAVFSLVFFLPSMAEWKNGKDVKRPLKFHI